MWFMRDSGRSDILLASEYKKGSHGQLVSVGGGSQRARRGIITQDVYNPATVSDAVSFPYTNRGGVATGMIEVYSVAYERIYGFSLFWLVFAIKSDSKLSTEPHILCCIHVRYPYNLCILTIIPSMRTFLRISLVILAMVGVGGL